MSRREKDDWSLTLSVQLPRFSDEVGAPKIARQKGWMPRIDLLEADSHLLVRVELAGVPQSNIQLSYNLDRNSLVIRGYRADDTHSHHERYQPHLLEIEEGTFAREVHLPTPDLLLKEVRTQLKSGILCIMIPKSADSSITVVEHVTVTEF